MQGAKVPMPKMPAIRNDGFVHSITDINSPVKMNFVDVTESQQFKRWFGDWQKHPNKASKVVNALNDAPFLAGRSSLFSEDLRCGIGGAVGVHCTFPQFAVWPFIISKMSQHIFRKQIRELFVD